MPKVWTLLDGDDAVLADLVDGLGDDLADLVSSAAEIAATCAICSLLLVVRPGRHTLQCLDSAASVAASMPRLK